jgi:putrescine aminotransferase
MKKDIKSVLPDFYTVDEALGFNEAKTKDLQHRHMNKTRAELCSSKYFLVADDFKFFDENGVEHIDMIGAVGVCSAGNNNRFIWDEVCKIVDAKQFNMGVVSLHNITSAFAANMAKLSPGGQLTKMATATGGAEAVENALKLVKLATRDKPQLTHILSCDGAFHGKTTGAVTVGGKDIWREWVTGLPTDAHDYVPFGDADALENALKKGIYKAFFFEPIQGENGIKVAPDGYFKKVRELCDKYDCIMVVDEIQCGTGRTGKLWCVEWEDVVPDVLIFAKGMSGGLMPFGGILAKEDVFNAAYLAPETCFHHTATYQDNHLCAAAGIAMLQWLYENDMIEQVRAKGEYLMSALKKVQAKYPDIVVDIRGRGFMVGIELAAIPEDKAEKAGVPLYGLLVENILINKYHIQILHTINNAATFRFLPPFTITNEYLDKAVDAVEAAIKDAIEIVG